ncbi:MAG: HAD hydrolase family protein, partial [Deltaproteobacteria bacterium]|nr:HAD hydrolase family protein [Deltaproteobacteria bacterium]
DAGQETKVFDVRDGHGIKLLMRAGIDAAIITSRESKAVLHRAANLGIKDVLQGRKDKLAAFTALLEKKGLAPIEAACMGDDLVDIPMLKRAGFSISVPDGVKEVRESCDYVTSRPGGKGAVREAVEVILKAQGRWEDVTGPYFR